MVLDLAAGQYVALCFVAGADGVPPPDEVVIPTPAAIAIAREARRPVLVMNDPSSPLWMPELVAVALDDTSALCCSLDSSAGT